MSTLLEIKTAVANYFEVAVGDLTSASQDLFLLAANQVRKTAELNHDFEFNRKLVTVTVNGATGGDLASALDSFGSTVDVKTVLEAGLLDSVGNVSPVEWTTLAESFERQRNDPRYCPRYPTDGQVATAFGGSRFTFSGNEVRLWPKTTANASTNYSLQLEVYGFSSDWNSAALAATQQVTVSGTLTPNAAGTYTQVGEFASRPLYIKSGSPSYAIWYVETGHWIIQSTASLLTDVSSQAWNFLSSSISPVGTYTHDTASTGTATVALVGSSISDIWTKHAAQFLQWATIVQLNHIFKHFVFRQEGNLPPPEKLAEAGLQALIEWDNYKYEQFRRHGR